MTDGHGDGRLLQRTATSWARGRKRAVDVELDARAVVHPGEVMDAGCEGLVSGNADRAAGGVDDEARAGHGRAESAVVAHVVVAQGERTVCSEGVVAQAAAVGVAAVAVTAPRSGVEIASVECAGVVCGRVQAVGIAGVVRVPSGWIVKRRGRVVAQPSAVEDALSGCGGAGEGHVVHVASVEEAAVKTAVLYGNVGIPALRVVKWRGRIVAQHCAIAISAKIDVPPVEHGTDVHLHPHGAGVVEVPALWVGEIPGDRVAEDMAAVERREVDMVPVKHGTVETGRLWVELLGIEEGIARGVL